LPAFCWQQPLPTRNFWQFPLD